MTMDDTDDIESELREATANPDVVSFAGGFPAVETFPREALIHAGRAALSEQSVAVSLQYAWPEGEAGLREWVSQRLAVRQIDVSPDEVIITSGAQQALSIAVDAVLERGQAVHVDALSYPGALDLFRARGLSLTCEPSRARCAYVMPGVANPSGHGIVRADVEPLLAANMPILADEAYGELRFDGAPPLALRPLAPERVFMIGSVSKSVCPGLRIGWLVPPRGMAKAVLENKRLDDLQASTFSQALILHWLRNHDYDAHRRRAVRLYRARGHCTVTTVRRLFPDWKVHEPEGGFSLYVDTGRELPEAELLEEAHRKGVVYDPGGSFRAFSTPDSTLALRLCYSNLSTALIKAGLVRLRRAWDAVTGASRPRASASSSSRQASS
jgi:2-aminoadipate transaminase